MVTGERESGRKYNHTIWDDASAVINTAERIQSFGGEERRQGIEAFLEWMKWEYQRLVLETNSKVVLINGPDKIELNPNTSLGVNITPEGKIFSMQLKQKLDNRSNSLYFVADLNDSNEAKVIQAISEETISFPDGSVGRSRRELSLSIHGGQSVEFRLTAHHTSKFIVRLTPDEELD